MVETNASSSATDEPAKSEDLPNDEGAIDGSIRVEGGNDEGNNVKRSNVESFKRMIKAAKKMSSRKKKREIRDADSEEEQNILEVEKKQNEEEGEANSKEDQELDGGLDEKGEKNPNGEGSKEDLSNENNPGKRKRKSKLKKKGDQKQIKEKSTHPAEDNILGDENLSDDSQSSGVARNEKVVHDDDDEDDHVGDGDDEDVDAKQKRERKKNKNKGKLRHTKDKSADQGGQKKKLKSSTKKSKFIDSVAEEGEEETESESDSEEYEEEDLIIEENDGQGKKKKKKNSARTGNLSTLSLLDDEGNYNDNEDIVDSGKSEKKKKSHFDEILENLKMKRKRVQKISEDEGLQYCENVLNQMILMHEQDIKNIKEKKPATAKLQIIDQVCMILTKPKWKPFFMKLNIYHVLALWLMPLSKNTLPNFTIRTNLLKVIQQLPITIKSLRGSQLGKIMTYLHTHKDETDENKKLIRTILQNWMGPIIGINTNYKQFLKERQKRILENPEYHKKVLEKAKTLLPDSISIEKEEEQNEMKKHATIPFNSECSFLINVPSSVPNSSKKIMPKSKIKRLTDNMKLLKRARKSQKVSIEGKGVAL
ncbi:IWS1-like protein, putative [Plasmodium knowlesi strain H]|uniref:IWS1-like protein, putative n=2 Tax=Plasmodium knowlesi (strain H) TaxID=5851 RepID=A0A5K1VRN0_PLAKH|nr:IWS1-like protein, putative [Plasmodium knowlesi strain H]CAA9988106.1 IWS1-like protein, putative [Plasmodium knowlesi strain H]SBO29109.1 IWS1-like protein, putative [Plasmodium knowlesi strain H]VVS77580.1 IWS1-like protein, putative [Plasmodium knowlesi strain H]|eukprot:XP_002259081.1 IWS1-like protein, putative [Plasmodium knowlesi strain H]